MIGMIEWLRKDKAGVTLVELMVSLVILVGIMTTAVLSTSTLREQRRAQKTAKDGETIIEALYQVDGLSFVSDFGRLPVPQTAVDATPDALIKELKALFANTLDGEDISLYREYPLTATGVIPSGSPIVNSPSYASKITSYLQGASLGTGWRGPYCRSIKLDTEERLLDGFGGEWVFEDSASDVLISTLTSYGRDQMEDVAEVNLAWQDKDISFPLHRSISQVDLDVEVRFYTATRPELQELRLYYFQPSFANIFETPVDAANLRNRLMCLYTSDRSNFSSIQVNASKPVTTTGVDSASSVSSGLTIGKRAFIIHAKEKDTTKEYIVLHYQVLHPGTNQINVTLREIL